MFLCMSASCMNLFFLTLFFISYYLLLFSLSQQDNYDDVCHVKIKKKFMKYYHIKSINPLKCNQKFDLFFLRSLNFGFNHFPSNRSLVFSIFIFWLVCHKYTFHRSVVYLLLFQEKQIIPTKAKTPNCKLMQCHVLEKRYLMLWILLMNFDFEIIFLRCWGISRLWKP